MSLNTYPYNSFPASTDKLDEAHNAELQQEIDTIKSGLTNVENELNGDATVYPYADVITIEDAVPANVAECSVKIEPVQSGSGDPSPENVRPITGHTEVSVELTDGDETTKTYTIALGDTIYGGAVDFDSGVMTVDRVCVDADTLTWQKHSTQNNNVYTTGSDATVKPSSHDVAAENDICSDYKTKPWSDLFTANTVGFGVANDGRFAIANPDITTLSDFETSIADTQICYELATPTTIQLTPQQIQLLKGQNTLTASTGQISVTVNGVSGAIGSLQTQATATDAALEELTADIVDKLPTAPTTDGAYVLTVTVADGTPTYSWESAT